MLEDIREKKTNRITYLLVIIAGIGMLFIGVPYFNHGGETNIATVNGQEVPLRSARISQIAFSPLPHV